jgi:hypothetical protein
MQLRAAELFFREQAVTVGDDQLMLADQEIVEMRGEAAATCGSHCERGQGTIVRRCQ